MASIHKRHSSQRSHKQPSKGGVKPSGDSSLSPGTLGAGFIILVVIGIAAGTVAAPQLFGREKVGSTREAEPEILATEYNSTLSDTLPDNLGSGDTSAVETVEQFDWASAPAPRGSSSDDIEIGERIEQSKVRAYTLIGQRGSIEEIHASFYPFSEIAQDRYYSALVDLTFIVDPLSGVVREICSGRATAGIPSTCATNPIELNP